MSHSIREFIERDDRIPIDELFHLYDNLVKEAINSRIHEIPGEIFEQGEMMSIEVENLTVPRIDFFTGEIDHMPVDFEQFPVYVSFNGENGPVESKIDMETSTPERLNVVVPEHAITGKINLLLPAVEVFNPEILFFKEEISTEQEHCLCKADPQEVTEDNLRDLILLKLKDTEALEEMVFYPRYVTFANIRCKCKINCPNKAIKYDQQGYCYVDPKICEGQKYYRLLKEVRPGVFETETYQKDGRTIHKRSKEIECWKCFEAKSCSLLRKVVYLDPDRCCGNCHLLARNQGKYIKEFCSYGAITGGRPITTSLEPRDYFNLDVEKCVGCMACYYGITCRNNLSTKIQTVHAVSYIPQARATLILKTITYHETPIRWDDFVPGSFSMGYLRYIQAYREPTKYRLVVAGKKKETMEFTLDGSGKHQFNRNIDFARVAGLELLENDTPMRGYMFFNHKATNLDTKEIPALIVNSATVDFKTKKGFFRLEYQVKTRR